MKKRARSKRTVKFPVALGPTEKSVKIEFRTVAAGLLVLVRERNSRKPIVLTKQGFVDRVMKIYRQAEFPAIVQHTNLNTP